MASQIKKPSHPADSASPASSASARGSLKSAKAGILIPKYMDSLLLSEEDDNSTMQFRPSLSMAQKTKTPGQESFAVIFPPREILKLCHQLPAAKAFAGEA